LGRTCAQKSVHEYFSLCLAAVITGIFGACHLIGWDFLYPSSVEQLLWRISSTFCAVTPILILMIALVIADDHDYWDIPYLTFLFPYFLARVYLLVAIFFSLRSVSAGVYQTVNWSLYFPHL
jgi:hypothetical protein